MASELTAKDALAAHVDAELGLTLSQDQPPPVVTALTAGAAFAVGSGVPLLGVLIAPDAWRLAVTLVAVVVSLAMTSFVLARMGTQVAHDHPDGSCSAWPPWCVTWPSDPSSKPR